MPESWAVCRGGVCASRGERARRRPRWRFGLVAGSCTGAALSRLQQRVRSLASAQQLARTARSQTQPDAAASAAFGDARAGTPHFFFLISAFRANRDRGPRAGARGGNSLLRSRDLRRSHVQIANARFKYFSLERTVA